MTPALVSSPPPGGGKSIAKRRNEQRTISRKTNQGLRWSRRDATLLDGCCNLGGPDKSQRFVVVVTRHGIGFLCRFDVFMGV
jgi:hypothetical protein